MKQEPMTLADFIDSEMRQRRMGVNEFARMCGVAHSSVSKHRNRCHPPFPDYKFIRALAKGTSTPILTLLLIAYPDLAEDAKIDTAAQVIASRLMKLPEETRNFVITVIESLEKSPKNH